MAVALVPTAKFVFGGAVPAPVDQIHQLPPWNGPAPDTPWDILQLDGALQFLPWRDYMLKSFRAGEIPLTNPYAFGGTHFIANSQSAPLYPLHWLWPFGAESLLSFSAWLHLFIAGLGVYIFARRLGGTQLGALIGGSGLMLSAFMLGWLQLPSVGMTAAWIPWCLAGVHRVFDERSGRAVAKLAAPASLMLLAGHLQIAAYGIIATALFAIWLAVSRRSLRAFGLTVVAALIAAATSSPQLLPAIAAGRDGHRAAPATEAGWDAYSSQAVTPQHLITLVAPAYFGLPNTALPGSDGTVPGYWLALQERGRHFAEIAFYVGPAVLALGIIALWRIRRSDAIAFLGALCLFSLLLALGTVVAKVMYFYLPGWGATGSPGRAAILFAVALCVLAGTAFRETAEEAGEIRPDWALAIAAILFLFGTGIRWITQSGEAANPSYVGSLTPFLIAFMFILAVSARKYSTIAAVAILVIGIAEPAIVFSNLNPGSPKGLYKEEFSGLEALRGKSIAVVSQGWPMFRAPRDGIAPPNSLMPYDIRTIGGYDSIIPARKKAALDAANQQDSAPPTNGNMLFVKPTFDPQAAADLGAELAISAIPLGLPVVEDHGNWKIYELPPGRSAPEPVPPPRWFFWGILPALLGIWALIAISYVGAARTNENESTG